MTNAVAIDAMPLVIQFPMNGPQVRAARELLGMSQQDLCDACEISRPTLRDIERETGDPKRSSLTVVEVYLRGRGIRFVDEAGVVGLAPARPK